MKRTGNPNINFRSYWNGIYGTPEKRAHYEAQGTDKPVQAGGQLACSQQTARFRTALDQVRNGDTVLDIGCGVGAFTKLVSVFRENCEIWGTDISDVVIKANQELDPTIHYLHQYIGRQDKVPSNYFDVVFSGEVLEHLDDPTLLFKDANRVLKQAGKFIVTTPNEENIRSEEHTWFFTREDIDKLYTENGFLPPTFINLPDMEWTLVIFASGYKK